MSSESLHGKQQLKQQTLGEMLVANWPVTAGGIGLLGVLGYGLSKMASGDVNSSNKMMKVRVLAQAGVVGLVLSMAAYATLRTRYSSSNKGE